MSESTREANGGTEPAQGAAPGTPAEMSTSEHRAFDEAAAQLVAAWDQDIDSRTPAEGLQALERLKTTAESSDRVQSPAPSPVAPEWTVDDEAEAEPRAERSRKTGLWLALAAAAAVLGGWLALQSGGPDTAETASVAAEPARTTETAATTAPAAVPAPSATTEDATPEPEAEVASTRFALTVRTIPPEAELTIEGKRVSNPYVGEHAASANLRLTASAKGHETAERELNLTEDVNLMVTLTPEEDEAVTQRRQKRRRRSTAQKRARRRDRQDRRSARAKRRRDKKKTAGFTSTNPYQ